jgi:serine/threonine protein kinase
MNTRQVTQSPSRLVWEFSDTSPVQTLRTDVLDWSRPASIPAAELIKENALRQVWRVNLSGTFYYAKLYLRNGKYRQIKRYLRGASCIKEWRVARYALEHGINCVSPVAYAVSSTPLGYVDSLLITAGKPRALPLTDYWRNLVTQTDVVRRAARISLLEEALAELLARAHQAGLAHSDLHPGNLLVEPQPEGRPNVCLVDLHSVRVGTPVSDREAVYNLAQLNQWFRQNATLTQRMRLLRKYMAFRSRLAGPRGSRWSESTFKHWARALDRAARKHADKLLASRDRRIMRNCKYFEKIHLPDHWQAHVFLKTKHPMVYSPATGLEFAAADWQICLQDPEKMLEEFARQMRPIKNSRSTFVCHGTLQVGPHTVPVVVKRHIRRKPVAALWDCFRKSRSLRAWKMSFAMLHRGLPVAQPLAVLERRIGPYLSNSIFITEEVKPSYNLRFFITSILPVIPADKRRHIKQVIIHQLAGLLRRMHQSGFAHRDMKATNILIYNLHPHYSDQVDPQSLRVVLVDQDGLKFKRWPSERDLLRALTRLSLSADLSLHITMTDRARFLKNLMTYYGSGIPDWKALWRKIATEREKSFQDHIPG